MNLKAIVLASALLVSASSFAASNPLIRSCNISEGIFEVTSPGTPDDYPYCHLGEGTLDAFSVHGAVSKDPKSEALSAFSSSYMNNQECRFWSAETVLVKFSREAQSLCVFSDGSKIDLESLQLGKDSGARKKMATLLFL